MGSLEGLDSTKVGRLMAGRERRGDSDRYANAEDVLPAELLRQVQEHWAGLLWVPSVRRRRLKTGTDVERNRQIRRDRERGLSLRELGEKYGLTKERVGQILRDSSPAD